MKKLIIIAGLQFAAFAFFAQQENDYAKLLDDPNATLQQKQAAFQEYWKNRDHTEKGKGWKQFKRWEYMMSTRVDASGRVPNPMLVFTEWKKAHAQFENKNNQRQNNSTQATATWQYIGPSSGVPNGGGAGRLCFITFDPVTPSTMWVGSPAGGLWKSTNSGASWTVVNDHLANLGAAHLAIDPTNSNIMYLSTGDRDATDTYSIGLLKSIDGGLTWNTTGLSYNVSQMRNVNCVLIDYTNTQILYAATGSGVYKSVDAGVNWLNVKSGGYKDLKFKPGDHNTIYACGSGFTRSANAGATWSNVNFPAPNGNSISRVAMAVTPADPTAVYVLGGQGATPSYGFAGFYKSTNSGVSFTKVCSSPNLLGWSPSGNDTGGQAWYDLIVAANPTNANEVICGGVNTWKSTNGGTSFSLFTHWYGGGGKPYVHADCHAIEYFPGNSSNIYIGCDGGLFSTTNGGTSWGMSSTGLQIGEQYRLGVSQSNQNYTMTGWQDNGCSLTNQGSSTTNYVLGGDGMECAIDPTTPTVVYGEQYNGSINKSVNTGGSFNGIVGTGGTGVNENGAWVTPYVIDPNNHNTLYVGKSQVYRSTNAGGSFSTLSTVTSGGSFIALAVAPSNSNYVYAAKAGEVWVTTNGNTFSQVALPYSPVTYLCVDPANPQRVWATIGGYTAGNKVYYSSNAGTTWINITGNLPNLPANCIAYGPGSNDGLYVGTDIGVYYKDNTLSNWIFYSNGLPNVIVDELEFQISTLKLRAATYGRGLWEIDAYTAPTSPPAAAFSSNKTTVCYGNSVNFYDNSTNLPSTWNWTFTGGTPASSNNQSPTITYSTPGTYPVKLVVTNNSGADSVTTNSYITVLPAPTITISNDTTICKGDSAQLCAFGGTQYSWAPINGLPNYYRQCPKAAPVVTKTYTVTVNNINGCVGTSTVKVTVIPPPPAPIVFQINDTLCCNPTTGVTYQWYYNGSPLTGETNSCLHVTANGTYSVQTIDTSMCHYTFTSAGFNVVNIGIKGINSSSGIDIYPNPAQSFINIKFGNSLNYQVKIYSAVGEIVYNQAINSIANTVYPLKLSLAPGVYVIAVSENVKKTIYTHKLIIVE
ncbi:MAG TPA: PKD domain-containing protein [Bacteroidia bacterium]|jgi:PKD repeat protein|nr:PKD domain-containing protein [Bacteroidia bacterium]